jgi:hypothetical protein
MKKIFLIIGLISFFSVFSQQVINSGNLIKAGLSDGSKLVEAYIKPINKAIVYGLSDVTYTKIKKDQKRSLMLSVKLAYISIPDDDLTFDVRKIGLEYFEPESPDKTMAQTIFGDSLKYITLVSKDKDLFGNPLIKFNTPGGGESSAMPLPFAGLTYRLPYTNLSVNLIPYIQIPDSDLRIGMIGAGVQQDLAMFMKSLQDKPLGISLQAGAAYLFGNAPLQVIPGGIISPVTITGNPTGPYDNQEVNIDYTSINLGVYADYMFDKFTFFAGTSINTGTSNIKVSGRYPIYTADPTGLGSVVVEDVDDPLDISNSFTRVKFEVGARADFDRFFIQLNYNMADYGGFGINAGYKMF